MFGVNCQRSQKCMAVTAIDETVYRIEFPSSQQPQIAAFRRRAVGD
jgi:hypothetical protein